MKVRTERMSDDGWKGKRMRSLADGALGTVARVDEWRDCGMEDCSGVMLDVRWDDGQESSVCSRACPERGGVLEVGSRAEWPEPGVPLSLPASLDGLPVDGGRWEGEVMGEADFDSCDWEGCPGKQLSVICQNMDEPQYVCSTQLEWTGERLVVHDHEEVPEEDEVGPHDEAPLMTGGAATTPPETPT